MPVSFGVFRRMRIAGILLASIVCIVYTGSIYAQSNRKQQGFSTFNLAGNTATFSCETQCVIVLDTLAQWDSITLKWKLIGQGTAGYGFLVGSQFVPGTLQNIQGGAEFDGKYYFSDIPQFGSLPKTALIAFLVQGSLSSEWLTLETKKTTMFEGRQRIWSSFWRNEPMTPYSINLRRWVMIGGTSIVYYAYIACILIGLYIFMRRWSVKWKHMLEKQIFIAFFGIFLFLGLRNLSTFLSITTQWITHLYPEEREKATYFELGDYIVFTEKIRETLHLDEITQAQTCKIYAEGVSNRPYVVHRRSVYLKPCVVVEARDDADYLLYYKKQPIEEITNENLLLSFQGSYLLKRK